MELVTHRVYLETDEFGIWGTLTFPAVQRLSDALNAADRRFLALTDVTLAAKDTSERFRHDFLALSVQHVILAVPAEASEEFDRRAGLGSRHRLPGPVAA